MFKYPTTRKHIIEIYNEKGRAFQVYDGKKYLNKLTIYEVFDLLDKPSTIAYLDDDHILFKQGVGYFYCDAKKRTYEEALKLRIFHF